MKLPDFRSWFAIPAYATYELFLIRGLFALVIWDIMPEAISIPSDPVKVGLGHWLNFEFLAEPGILITCRFILMACLTAYCAGVFLPIALPIILILIVSAGTIDASFGAHTHSKQIVVLCLLAQCIWHLVAAFNRNPDNLQTLRGGVFAGAQAIAASYVISAISKIFGDGNWLADSVNHFQIQATKNIRMKYYNSLSEKTAEVSGGIQGALHNLLSPILASVEHLLLNSQIWRALFLGGGFMLELFAFLALANRKLSLFIGGSLIVFHLSVFEIMGLKFRYNIYLLLIFFVGIPFWIASITNFFTKKTTTSSSL